MRNLMIATAAATMLATPAFAQSNSSVGGARIEATVGWDRPVLHIEDQSEGKSGVSYGAEFGYDFALSDFVFAGAYAGIDGASTKECISSGTETACVKAGRNITAGVRVGTRVGGKAAVYVKGGYSNGRITGTYTDSAAPALNDNASENMDGYHLGAGVQVDLQGHVYVKAEYNYSAYKHYDVFGYDTHLDRHRIVAGVGVRF